MKRTVMFLLMLLLMPLSLETLAGQNCTGCHNNWQQKLPVPGRVTSTTTTTKLTSQRVSKVVNKAVKQLKTRRALKRNAEIKRAWLTGKIKVQKGDTLSALASQGWGAGRLWTDLAKANGINPAKPRKLQIGEILMVPKVGTIQVTHHLTSPYRAKAEQGSRTVLAAIEQTLAFYSEPIKQAMILAVNSAKPMVDKVVKGELADCISSGKTGVTCNSTGYKFSWPKIDRLSAKSWDNILADGKRCTVKVIDSCGNFMVRCVEKSLPLVPVFPPISTAKLPPPVFPPISTAKLPPPVFPPISTVKPRPLPPVPLFPAVKPVHQKFEMYYGAGYYEGEGRTNSPSADGSFHWLKARYRPFEYPLFGQDGAAGIFGFLADGNGHDGSYKYNWNEAIGGLTNKIFGKHWDLDADTGLGALWNSGGNQFVDNHQQDLVFYQGLHLNQYSRRDAGEKWLPKTELNFELRLPFSTKKNSNASPVADNRTVEGTITQGLVDIPLGNGTLLTPGINLGAGHDYGLKQDFWQFGPEVRLSVDNDDLVGVNFLNFKDNLGGARGQWQWISGFVSVHGLWKVVYRALITEVPVSSVPALYGTPKTTATVQPVAVHTETSPAAVQSMALDSNDASTAAAGQTIVSPPLTPELMEQLTQ